MVVVRRGLIAAMGLKCCAEILFEGRNIATLNERELEPVRRKIGMLFQDGALFDSLTVYDNVAFPLRERGERDETVVARKVEESLALVNMPR